MLGAPGELDGSPSPIARVRAAARMLNRRSVVIVLVFGTFLGALLLASTRLGEYCTDAAYCPNLSSIHKALPFGKQKPHDEAAVTLAPTPTDVSNYIPTETPTDELYEDTSDNPNDDSSNSSNDNANDDSNDAPTQAPGPKEEGVQFSNKFDPLCADFPDTSNILLVMKTGASEAYSKIPTQVLTNLRCVFDYLMFSDMEQEIAGHVIHDSLDTVRDDVKKDNQDFDLYRHQQSCMADQASCNKGHDVASQGWALDKYKNIHMAEKAYRLRPDHDWYMFVDADTYVLWSTLVEWLMRIDSTKPHYLGSVAMLGDFPFGHGGSGYLVSKATMQQFFRGKTNVANNWDADASETCCGDFMFAYALKNDTDIGVQNMWPTINGEKPYTLAYGPSQWCQPIATMHHIGSEEVSDFDAFEQLRNFSSPVLIKDLYEHFVANKLIGERNQWDNMSDDVLYLDASEGHHQDWEVDRSKKDNLSDVEKRAHLSFDNCRRACLEDQSCFQFKFHDGLCTLGYSFIHGHPRVSESEFRSGWDVQKMKAWVEEHKDCGEISWPSP